MLKREVFEQMVIWKDDQRRKPLILEGARQVGKTWLMKEFGRLHFEDVAYFNFDKNEALKNKFADTKEVATIVERLSLLRKKLIESNKTLIIFDEVQECPNALNSLKYFNEDGREYFVVSAGSLLGVYLANQCAHPVGQVNILKVFPLSFAEFLNATDNSLFAVYNKTPLDLSLLKVFHDKFIEAYKKYLIIGGMPESVNVWIETKDPQAVNKVHEEIQLIYERDFTKHHGKVEPERILMVYRNIPAQLSKQNNKFIYGDVQKGARARSFETAIEWLVTAGLVNRIYRATKNESPLKSFRDLSGFKLYYFDTGLLASMAEVESEQIILNKSYQFKGSLTENYVLQQLSNLPWRTPAYYTFDDRYEIDFLVQDKHGDIIPIETKAGESVSSTSFNAYNKKYNPKVRIRYSLLEYKKDNNVINIPLYLVGKTLELI